MTGKEFQILEAADSGGSGRGGKDNNLPNSETGPSGDPFDLVREFNKQISALISKADSGEEVSVEELEQLDRQFNELDVLLSDQSFDSDEIGKLYDNFQKRIPGRIERLKALITGNTIAFVSRDNTASISKPAETPQPTVPQENGDRELVGSWPPEYVTELRNILISRRDHIKTAFYPGDKYIFYEDFQLDNPDDVSRLKELEKVLSDISTPDSDTKQSDLDRIIDRKRLVEKALRFLENSSRVSDVEKHDQLEQLLKDTEEFLQGFRDLEIALYQEMAPLIHPEIKDLIDTALSVDITGATTPAQIYEKYRSFAFDQYQPHVDEKIAAVQPITENLEKQGKEGYSSALTETYIVPAQKEVDNWKTIAFDYWKDNLEQLYPSVFASSDPNSYISVLEKYEDTAKIYSMDLEDLYKVSDFLKNKLGEAKKVLASGTISLPDAKQDSRYREKLESYYKRGEAILEKISQLTREQTEPSMATRTAVKFFEGGFAPDSAPEWRDGRWRTEHPAKLAKAIWSYIEQVLLKGEARADLAYMSVDVLGTHLDLPDSPTIVSLLRAFISLSKDFKGKIIDGKDKGTLFFEIGDKMITDIVQIQRIYSFGNEVHKREQDPHALIAYFTESGNQMTYVDHERTYQMGVNYMDHEGGIALSERLLWAQQAYFAMHEPIYHKNAVVGSEGYQTASVRDKKDIVYGVDQKNPLTFFPEAVGNENERLIKRYIIRQIAGSDTPPAWVNIKRNPGETLHEWYVRKLDLMRADIETRYKDLRDKFEKNSTTNQANRKDEWLTQDEIDLINKGYIAEQLSHNLGEYSLEPCKAEGQDLLNKGSKHRVETSNGTHLLPVLNPHKGPTAIFYVSRFWSIGDYRAKLTQEEGGGEGATGPRETMRDFNSIMDTQYDYYFFIPQRRWKDPKVQLNGSETEAEKKAKLAAQRKKESQGITLKEAIVLSDNLTDTKNIPFSTALSSPYRGGTEQLLGWYEQIRLSENHWNRIIKADGLGVNWAQLRRFEPGSGGAMVTFDPSTVTAKLYPFAREVTYMMQRDKGVKMYDWKDEKEWLRHLGLEKNYVAQLKSGVEEPVKPLNFEGAPVTDEEWDKVREYRIAPTYRYKMVDMYDPGDQKRTKVVRYAHQWHEVVKAPNNPENRDEFEDAVFRNPDNTAWDIYKKLFIGKIIIGSISVGDVENIGFKEIQSIFQVLSREAWEKSMTSFLRKFTDFASGRLRHPAYQGLGFFSMLEVSALLRRAGVNTRWGSVIQDLMETLAKVK